MGRRGRLFDIRKRDYMGPKTYGESKFEYLNRSARPSVEAIRNRLESWFQNYPPEGKADVRKRFRSRDSRQHLSAFFEIYMYHLLTGMGFIVELHPKVEDSSRHPDFKVLKDDTPLFYLELTLSAISDQEAGSKARVNQFYDTLNKLHTPNFFIDLQVHEVSSASPSGRKVLKFLENKVSKLDPDLVTNQYEESKEDGFKSFPNWEWEYNGWKITFSAIPKKLEARGRHNRRPLGIISSEWEWLGHPKGIVTSIHEKNRAYGNLGLPYIVGINVVNEFPIRDVEIRDVLFGGKIVIENYAKLPDGNIEFNESPVRLESAFFGPNGPRNRKVSAALIVRNLDPWNMAREDQTPLLWHNPWAYKPLGHDVLPLPQKMIDAKKGLVHLEGKSANEFLGLDPAWPEQNK